MRDTKLKVQLIAEPLKSKMTVDVEALIGIPPLNPMSVMSLGSSLSTVEISARHVALIPNWTLTILLKPEQSYLGFH